MDGTIKVSTQELRSASSQFSSYGSEIQNLTSQMLSLISELQELYGPVRQQALIRVNLQAWKQTFPRSTK